MGYLFSMNGAGIKMHDTQQQALRQARQWKGSNPSRQVKVEEHVWNGKTYARTHNDVEVEMPMLVPGLTPMNDWDPAGT